MNFVGLCTVPNRADARTPLAACCPTDTGRGAGILGSPREGREPLFADRLHYGSLRLWVQCCDRLFRMIPSDPNLRPIPQVDDSGVAAMTHDIVNGTSAALAPLFAKANLPCPLVHWDPWGGTLPTPGLRFLLQHWLALRGTRSMPSVEQVDALDMGPALGNILVLDVLDGGEDFRFRVYGAALATTVGLDWTNHTISQMRQRLPGVGPAFYLAGYRAALQRRQPLYTVNQANLTFEHRRWARLILPLSNVGGTEIVRFLVGNYALDENSYLSPDEERRLESMREAWRALERAGSDPSPTIQPG
jgi:hypothetical protein